MEKLQHLTFSSVLDKKKQQAKDEIFCFRVGKIKQINLQATGINQYVVELIDRYRWNNTLSSASIITCFAKQDCSATNGNVNKYKVGDVVCIQFADVNYNTMFENQNTESIIFDKDDAKQENHAFGNGTITGFFYVKPTPIDNGIFSNDFILQPVGNQVRIQNQAVNFLTLWKTFIAEIKTALVNDITTSILNSKDSLGKPLVPQVSMTNCETALANLEISLSSLLLE